MCKATYQVVTVALIMMEVYLLHLKRLTYGACWVDEFFSLPPALSSRPLGSAESDDVLQKCERVLEALDQHDEELFSEWTKGLEEICHSHLQEPLLTLDTDTGLFHLNFNTAVRRKKIYSPGVICILIRYIEVAKSEVRRWKMSSISSYVHLKPTQQNSCFTEHEQEPENYLNTECLWFHKWIYYHC